MVPAIQYDFPDGASITSQPVRVISSATGPRKQTYKTAEWIKIEINRVLARKISLFITATDQILWTQKRLDKVRATNCRILKQIRDIWAVNWPSEFGGQRHHCKVWDGRAEKQGPWDQIDYCESGVCIFTIEIDCRRPGGWRVYEENHLAWDWK